MQRREDQPRQAYQLMRESLHSASVLAATDALMKATLGTMTATAPR